MSIAVREFTSLANRYLIGTMDISEIRRANMLGLLADFRTLEELAEHYDLVANYLSQIKSGSRNMGDRFARGWEKKMGKPRGWFDTLQFHSPDEAMGGLEAMQIFQSLSEEDREAWLKHGRLLGKNTPKGPGNPFGGSKHGGTQ
jgi:hypothetical protein